MLSSQGLIEQERALRSSLIVAGLEAFPSELVEQTRARIRAKSRVLQDIVIEERPRVQIPSVPKCSNPESSNPKSSNPKSSKAKNSKTT